MKKTIKFLGLITLICFSFFYTDKVIEVIKENRCFEDFDDEEIEQLKLLNDWNQQISFDKCIRKEIVKSKPDVPYEQEIRNRIIDEFQLADREYNLFLDFLTSDSDDCHFIIYGYIWENDKADIYFVGLGEGDTESLEELKFLVPSEVFDSLS